MEVKEADHGDEADMVTGRWEEMTEVHWSLYMTATEKNTASNSAVHS